MDCGTGRETGLYFHHKRNRKQGGQSVPIIDTQDKQGEIEITERKTVFESGREIHTVTLNVSGVVLVCGFINILVKINHLLTYLM